MVRRFLSATVALFVGVLTVVVTASPAHADEIRDKQWYLNDLGINEAHKLSQGKGVTIGVIDSGIDAEHPDLKGNVKAGRGYGGGAAEDGLTDSRGHGTSVASVLAGHGHGADGAEGILGVAPQANIVSVGLHWEGRDDGPRIAEEIADAIKWLVDHKVDLISTSVSAGGDASPVDYATKHGVPVVAAAGNLEASEADAHPGHSTGTDWPARVSGAIPVSGTTPSGDFWDEGLTLEAASAQPKYGISAPAQDIPVAEPGGEYTPDSRGTSFATPIVSGTMALIKSAYPDLDLQTWIARMLETVDDKGSEGYDDEFGHGIVNPLQALTEDVKVKDEFSDIESKASDRLPLDEQGKQDSAAGSMTPEGPSEGSDFVLTVVSVAGALIVLLALITVPIIQSRRKP